jgi:F-type H+-transporting ATPase subunit a
MHEPSLVTYFIHMLLKRIGVSDGVLNTYLPDHVVMVLFLVLLAAIALPLLRRRFKVYKPGGFQQILELTVEGIRSLLGDIIGHKADQHLVLLGTFGIFIFVMNFCGMVPGLGLATSSLWVTVPLALISFTYYNYHGVKTQGVGNYLKHFCGPIWWLALLMFPIELISHCARPLSLSVRLFGNMFGEHQVSGVFMSLVPALVPIPVMVIGLFAIVLQAFIFMLLSAVYVGGAIEVEDH